MGWGVAGFPVFYCLFSRRLGSRDPLRAGCILHEMADWRHFTQRNVFVVFLCVYDRVKIVHRSNDD